MVLSRMERQSCHPSVAGFVRIRIGMERRGKKPLSDRLTNQPTNKPVNQSASAMKKQKENHQQQQQQQKPTNNCNSVPVRFKYEKWAIHLSLPSQSNFNNQFALNYEDINWDRQIK